jgi:SAM-dependent methyltransferase
VGGIDQMKLQKKAEELSSTVFLGGPTQFFESVGRLQLIVLLKEGLYPDSKVLDIGCGCLRGGYWLIHFLNPNCYFGIEPNRKMLELGMQNFLGPDVTKAKKPKFDYNQDFDSSIFGEKFDFFLARSIWTHASKIQIQKMLDSFVRDSKDDGVFLTSVLKRYYYFKKGDYKGDKWVGRNQESDAPGNVYHSFRWIRNQCRQRGLVLKVYKDKCYNFGNQIWLEISKKNRSVVQDNS